MRVKTGFARKRHHKKILALAKGQRMSRHRLFKTANEAVLHAGEYAYVGRRLKKRDLRKLWIIRINAAVKKYGLTYGRFISLLKNAKISLNRKILAHLAVNETDAFKTIVEKVKPSK